jgi:SAM-dependent methyltransferase
MEYSFQRYLTSKQTIDDRSLNQHVIACLKQNLPDKRLSIIEVGAGIGTMPARLIRWGLLSQADYIAVDEMAENTRYARDWIPHWAVENRLRFDRAGQNQIRVFDDARDVRITFEQADVFDYIRKSPLKANLLIAHAFLDLLPMPESLNELFSLLKPGGLAWLTINFDGVTTLEPSIDPAMDAKIERLYHQSMDLRPSGGDSQSGRHLFRHLHSVGAEILASGASDWVVHAINRRYPADEAYFLNFILYFFEQSLSGNPELEDKYFKTWLAQRRAQIDKGQLVYIAHQMDFLVRIKA